LVEADEEDEFPVMVENRGRFACAASLAVSKRDARCIRAQQLARFRVELTQLDAGPEGAKGGIGAAVYRINPEWIDDVEIVAILRHQYEALIPPTFAGLERVEGRIGHEPDGPRVTCDARRESRLAASAEGTRALDGWKPSAA
jgi:hypothetical protein